MSLNDEIRRLLQSFRSHEYWKYNAVFELRRRKGIYKGLFWWCFIWTVYDMIRYHWLFTGS